MSAGGAALSRSQKERDELWLGRPWPDLNLTHLIGFFQYPFGYEGTSIASRFQGYARMQISLRFR